MINNIAPEKLVNIYGVQSYTKLYIQHSFNLDIDLLGKAFWVYNSSQSQVKEWLVTDPGHLGYTSVTIPGLVQDTSYTVKGQFYDQMIDPELLQAKFGINISDPISLKTKKAPSLSNVTVTATQVEVGVSNPTVNFFCQGDADFIEIQYKLQTQSTWSSCYSGQITSPVSMIFPVGTYNFRVRGKISLPDGVTIEESSWYQYPSTVEVQYKAIPPSKPTGIGFSVQKIKDGIQRYDVKVEWDWERAQGAQIKQFIVEYTPASKYAQSGWSGSQKVNTSSTESQILVNFPFDVDFRLRVLATSWGPNDGTMTTQSDIVSLRITPSTPITDNFTKETGVEVGYFGVNQYKGTGAQRVQTFKLDQATGNLSIGIADAQGKVPFSFDAINNIFNVSGRIITDIINAASFVLTNTSGTPAALYSQEKPQYGNLNQGIWMGYSGGKFLFDLGNSSQYVRWDGSTLRIQGNVVIGTPGGDTSLSDALKGKSVVPIYNVAQQQPSRPTGTSYPPSGWSTSPPQFNPNTQKIWVSTGTIDPLTNTLVSGYQWSTPTQFSGQQGSNGQPGQNGANGQSSFKSVVFLRSNSTPTTPTGGSYSSSVPSGWSDGVPSGTQKLWSSTRIFTSDGKAPQQQQWTQPQPMTDTSSLEIKYSSVQNPGTPQTNPSNWSSTASTSSIWMQTRTQQNGVWSSWSVVKVKGETGAQGPTGPAGSNGAAGQRGPGFYQQAVATNSTDFNISSANSFFTSTFGSQQVKYDCLTQFRSNNPQVAWTRMWNGSSWVAPALVVHGDLIANGTIRGEKIVADQAFFQKAGIDVVYDRAAQLSANPEGTYKMKIDLAAGSIHIR